MYISKKPNQTADTIPFKICFQNLRDKCSVIELSFGNTSKKDKLPVLPGLTGKHTIAQSVFFYDGKQTSNNRTLSFQLWYPAESATGKKLSYRSKSEVKAAANFLGWPLFNNSFLSMVKSNSYPDAKAVDGKFPLLIYNHGYGGFTGVYQTICEDLASHGYIVVSLGHQNESALLLKDNQNVLPNSPLNKFYAKRAAELNGAKINELQSTILNSDDSRAVRKAYEQLQSHSPLHNESTRLWASDTKELLSKLKEINVQDNHLKGIFDFEKTGVFGHSVGGATSGELAFDCNEIKAGINLDGFQFGDLIHNNLKVPFMFVSSNESGNRYLRISPFAESSQNDCHHAVIRGYSHNSFSDLVFFNPNGAYNIDLQRHLIRYFFDKYLKNSSINLPDLENLFPEIKFKTQRK